VDAHESKLGANAGANDAIGDSGNTLRPAAQTREGGAEKRERAGWRIVKCRKGGAGGLDKASKVVA